MIRNVWGQHVTVIEYIKLGPHQSHLLHEQDISVVDSSSNVMAHGDTWGGSEGETGEWEWVASTLHTISEHNVSSITTADATPRLAVVD